MNATRLLLPALVAAALSACGGGGGSAGNTAAPAPVGTTTPAPAPAPSTGTAVTAPATAPAVTPGGTWLTLTPSPVSLTATQGQSVTFDVTAKSSQIVSRNFNIGILDSRGVITTDVQLAARSDLDYVATLHTAPGLPVGTNSTYLEVRLCADDPLTCRQPLAGSPWYLPLTVVVK
jgi:hypothetical protein